MQPEARFASSLSEEIGAAKENATSSIRIQSQSENQMITNAEKGTAARRRALKLDTISAAVVVGMTALFVVSILCLATDFVPRIIDTILLSVFIGLCAGVIAFALMKGDD